MIKYRIKGIVINVLYFLVKFLPSGMKANRWQRFLYIKRLKRIDEAVADVEIAKDLGVKIGKDCRFYGVEFGPEPYLVEIGDGVLISNSVMFITHDGAIFIFMKEKKNIAGQFGKIKIGNNCFIGFRSIILPNVQLGDNCIVAAGSVVADSFPDNSVIMGNPAKLIFKTELFKKMKLLSKLTIYNDDHPFPDFDVKLPHEVRKEIILNSIDQIPIRKPRK